MTVKIEHFILLHSIYRNSGQPLPPLEKEDIQKVVTRLKCRAEIIGTWVYCFVSPEIGLQLLAVGFWFSFKHNTYVYSGYPKGGPANDETLDEIRGRLGKGADY
ncbi:MAG: hypothetical protein LBB48_05035 [Treponema sp.]|nr:hypothetical protein [Treponema sp.]